MCRGSESPETGREGGEAGNFSCWVWIPREMARSKEVRNFLPVQSNLEVILGQGGGGGGSSWA